MRKKRWTQVLYYFDLMFSHASRAPPFEPHRAKRSQVTEVCELRKNPLKINIFRFAPPARHIRSFWTIYELEVTAGESDSHQITDVNYDFAKFTASQVTPCEHKVEMVQYFDRRLPGGTLQTVFEACCKHGPSETCGCGSGTESK